MAYQVDETREEMAGAEDAAAVESDVAAQAVATAQGLEALTGILDPLVERVGALDETVNQINAMIDEQGEDAISRIESETQRIADLESAFEELLERSRSGISSLAERMAQADGMIDALSGRLTTSLQTALERTGEMRSSIEEQGESVSSTVTELSQESRTAQENAEQHIGQFDTNSAQLQTMVAAASEGIDQVVTDLIGRYDQLEATADTSRAEYENTLNDGVEQIRSNADGAVQLVSGRGNDSSENIRTRFLIEVPETLRDSLAEVQHGFAGVRDYLDQEGSLLSESSHRISDEITQSHDEARNIGSRV